MTILFAKPHALHIIRSELSKEVGVICADSESEEDDDNLDEGGKGGGATGAQQQQWKFLIHVHAVNR